MRVLDLLGVDVDDVSSIDIEMENFMEGGGVGS